MTSFFFDALAVVLMQFVHKLRSRGRARKVAKSRSGKESCEVEVGQGKLRSRGRARKVAKSRSGKESCEVEVGQGKLRSRVGQGKLRSRGRARKVAKSRSGQGKLRSRGRNFESKNVDDVSYDQINIKIQNYSR